VEYWTGGLLYIGLSVILTFVYGWIMHAYASPLIHLGFDFVLLNSVLETLTDFRNYTSN